MILKEQRIRIVEYGIRMLKNRLVCGPGGNLSIYSREEDLVAITPSNTEYTGMRPEDVLILSPEGVIVQGDREPSRETGFHLSIYKHRKNVNSIVHTHSVYATTFACLNKEIPPVTVGTWGNKVPVAPYATPGTEELALNIIKTIKDYNTVLLANHGLVSLGPDLPTAFNTAEETEFAAQVYYQARNMGEPLILTDERLMKYKNPGT